MCGRKFFKVKVIVQKFGGTSVRDEKGRNHALKHIQKAVSDGYKCVIVVSAMGRLGDAYATDTLLSLIGAKQTLVSKREQDLLLSCGENISAVVFSQFLNQNGIHAEAFTGGQAGIQTNDAYTDARIKSLHPKRINEAINRLDAVVVAGFQGVNTLGDVTTLGRGGSDTSASIMGVLTKAERIDIFTDVLGVMTADPRLVVDAKMLEEVTYDEVANLAHEGAKVIHPRAVEIAANANIPLRVRSTYSEALGTLITNKSSIAKVKDHFVTGITHVENLSQIKVKAKVTHEDFASQIFQAMAEAKISVDFINISPKEIVYTVQAHVAESATNILNNLGFTFEVKPSCAKVAIVGAAITGVPGIIAKMVTALSKENIEILQSADSLTTIWVLVDGKDLKKSVNILHHAFAL